MKLDIVGLLTFISAHEQGPILKFIEILQEASRLAYLTPVPCRRSTRPRTGTLGQGHRRGKKHEKSGQSRHFPN